MESARTRALAGLGGRCAATTCHWLNDDGTMGCNDERALMFHHIDGGGSALRSGGKDSQRMLCYEVLRCLKDSLPVRIQLLCGACHEIDKKVNKRAQGARQHRQPARIRRSRQIEGQPLRRVREKPDLEYLRAEQSFLAAMKRHKTNSHT